MVKIRTSRAKSAVKNTYRDAKNKVHNAKEKTENYISKNPKKAVAIAAGVGVAAALASRAIMRRRR